MLFTYTTTIKKMLADLYTPVGIYMRMRDVGTKSMLMESSDYHGNDNARSFVGINPIASISVGHNEINLIFPTGKQKDAPLKANIRGRPRMM